MRHPKAKRDWEIRQALRAKLADQLSQLSGGLGLKRPEIDRHRRELRMATKGKHMVEFGDDPQGIVFKDGSFLTIAETWSEEGKLLSFSVTTQAIWSVSLIQRPLYIVLWRRNRRRLELEN